MIIRMEKMEISKRASQAKVVGTVVAFGGAAFMTLYKGTTLVSVTSLAHDSHNHGVPTTSKLSLDKDWIKSSLLLFVSLISLSGYYVLQVLHIWKSF